MKKFLVTLFLLIILGGAGFFLGWVQLSVPAGSYGVLRSKTHGIDPRLIIGGEFRWVWYKLLPTNAAISIFRIEAEQRAINVKGVLPSGDIYALFAGDQVDFSWEINASFTFSIKPEKIVMLVDTNNIFTQEEFLAFQHNLADQIETFIIRSLSTPTETDLEGLLNDSNQELEKKVQKQFPMITNFSCLVKNVKFPDWTLYRQVRSLYEEFIEKQREQTSLIIDQKANNRINMLLRLDELERYGVLLNKYPVLLQYLLQKPQTE